MFKTFGMDDSEVIENLKERIKELTCLYEISSLSVNRNTSIEEKLQGVCNCVSVAWKHADEAIAEISALESHFTSAPISIKTVYLVESIELDGRELGYIRVHYPSANFTEGDFLPEEAQLLHKVAQEVSGIIERHIQHEKEEMLKRSVERTDRMTILGEITAGIAHELNTPLGNILGFSQLITNSADDKQVLRDAEKITNSAIYAREVVKKLMFFSCEIPTQIESTSINLIVNEALTLLKPSLQNAGVDVDFIPDSKNPFGRFDPIQITQLVFNLMINAIYASTKGGKIEVKIASNEKLLKIEIADHGTGIPVEIRDKIFEPFFTTKPVGEGSGLGLSVVHGIVLSHGGTIHFSSHQQSGTTFKITLPLHP